MNSSTARPLVPRRSRGLLRSAGESARSDDRREQPLLAESGVLMRYGLAGASVTLALALTYVIQPLQEQPPVVLFFVAVVLTSWYAGERAAIVATVLSLVAIDLVFVRPDSFHLELLDTSVDLLAFAVGTLVVSNLQDRWRRTHRRLVTVEYDLEIARRIQQQFFPSRAPALPGIELSGACFPAAATGGDLFDYIPMAGGRLGIVIGDVSGHGVGPALVMALVRAYLRALALTHLDPGEILTEANRLVHQDTAGECFVTVFLAQLDPRTDTLQYAAAGHEAYLLDPSGRLISLESTGLPLGVEVDAKIACGRPTVVQPQQILLLVSDGVAETGSTGGEPFGLARAIETVRAQSGQSAQEIVAALYRAARDFRGSAPQEDDITIVVLKAGCPGD